MAKNVSLAEVNRMKQALVRARTSMSKVRDAASETVDRVLGAAEIGGTAFGFGYLKGRTGQLYTIAGISADLLAFLSFHALALFGVTDKYTSHFVNLGNGALASYAVTQGVRMGARAASPGVSGSPRDYMSGHEEQDEGMGLTRSELDALGIPR